MKTIRLLILAVLVPALGISCSQGRKPVTEGQAQVDYGILLTLPEEPVSFTRQVKPILDRRCVVCHGCYDAPCQVKLTSWEGIDRGASKEPVYDGGRLKPARPTRMFIDAKTTAQWRERGFYSILNESPSSDPYTNLNNSVLYRLLRLKQLHPQPRAGMLPDSFTLELDRTQSCPTPDEFDRYASTNPLWGMPYAMPNLSDREYRMLVQWLAQGSPNDRALTHSDAASSQVARWESFLNGESMKQQLVSRYVYEHLFLAHIHFENTPDREFYRLVRSTTPSGSAVDEIATERPYDDPGTRSFYYRFTRYPASIVAKNHIVYTLSPQRMARYKALFLERDYSVTELPGYERKLASNPFRAFEALPEDSRYRFLLDDARFFIEGFVKGPVCRGQIALNVIEDQFWVVFFDPDTDPLNEDPGFLDEMADNLKLPADRGNTLDILSIWTDYWESLKKYMLAKQAYFKKIQTHDIDEALEYIWDGDGTNPNAALTVFRHFDSASVRFGLAGDDPETAWVIDYPLLERIHYLLVAGFDVFGNAGHQLNTRLYMDFLRMEGEDYFLAFMPASDRKKIRDSWYQGVRERLDKQFDAPMDWLSVESVTGYQTDDPQREFYRHLEAHLGCLAGNDPIDRADDTYCEKDTGENKSTIAALRKVAALEGAHLRVFPDVALLRVRSNAQDGDTYSIIRNKAYKNITSIFEDTDRRDRDSDTLTVVRGIEGSYPNFFFSVQEENIGAFAEKYLAIRNREDYERFVALYGIRRTEDIFWDSADWFQDYFLAHEPVRAGLLDLNRYGNR